MDVSSMVMAQSVEIEGSRFWHYDHCKRNNIPVGDGGRWKEKGKGTSDG